MSPSSSIPGFVILSLLSANTFADTFNLSWDNDLLVGLDQGYTNGVRLSYLTASAKDQEASSSGVARKAGEWFDFLPGITPIRQDQAVSLTVRQLMVTPEDISRSQPAVDDLPYAGYLSVGAGVWSWDDTTINGYGAHLGVIGPESGAEASQRWVHKLTGSDKPRGWDTQIGTDVVAGFHATHARKFWQSSERSRRMHEMAWVGSTMLSSFRTHARVGTVWRFGHNLPVNFVPDYAGTSTAVGLPGAVSRKTSGWSVFVGLGLEYVAYSYLEAEADPYRFEESPLLVQAGLGGTWQWQSVQAALTFRATTGEQETNKDSFSFGTLSLTWVY